MLVDFLQNEDLTSIGVKLADHIAEDQLINSYCYDNFSKKITVVVAADEASVPDEDYAPYVFINSISKNEGRSDKAQYEIYFSIGISAEEHSAANTEKGTLVLTGAQRVSELMTLVQNSLNTYKDSCNPPVTVEATILGRVGNSPTFWMGAIAAVWQIDLPIGAKIEF